MSTPGPLRYEGAPVEDGKDLVYKKYVDDVKTADPAVEHVDDVVDDALDPYADKAYADTQDALLVTPSYVNTNDNARLNLADKGVNNGVAPLDVNLKIPPQYINATEDQDWLKGPWTPTTYNTGITTVSTSGETTLYSCPVTDPGYAYKLMIFGAVDVATDNDTIYPQIIVRQGNETTGQIVAQGFGHAESYGTGIDAYIQATIVSTDTSHQYPIVGATTLYVKLKRRGASGSVKASAFDPQIHVTAFPVNPGSYNEENLDLLSQPVPESTGCWVTLVGGGGGGGAGGESNSDLGGQGGGGGARLRVFIPRASLGDTYTVMRGLGGKPGKASWVQFGDNAGGPGLSGGHSVFNSGSVSLFAGGGSGGLGSSNTVAAGGTASLGSTTGGVSANGTASGANNTGNAGAGGGHGGNGNGGNGTKGGDSPARTGGDGGIGNGWFLPAGGPGGSPAAAVAAGDGGAGGGGGGGALIFFGSGYGGEGGTGGLYGGGGGGGGGANSNGGVAAHGGVGGDGYTLIEWV